MRNILFIIIALSGFSLVKAQDPQFSQFYASPLYLGPSFAGATNGTRMVINYRDQWPSISGRYITYALSLDHYFVKYKSGGGLMILQDNAGHGKQTLTNIAVNYSYRIDLNKKVFFQPGLQVFYTQRTINFNKLVFADQYLSSSSDASTVESDPGKSPGHLDFSTSMLLFSKDYWGGFSLDHLMKLNSNLASDDRYVDLKFSMYGGYNFKLKKTLINKLEQTVTVAFNYRTQSSIQQLDLGVYYHQYPIMIGLWYRGIPIIKTNTYSDSFTLSGGVELSQITFTYSYDMTVSPLITSTGGAHELSLIYNFDNGNISHRRRMTTVPCPRF
jgi:type IX secretion system PorP/SprF family membrane protein